jgi:uncharacterized membrane protein
MEQYKIHRVLLSLLLIILMLALMKVVLVMVMMGLRAVTVGLDMK